MAARTNGWMVMGVAVIGVGLMSLLFASDYYEVNGDGPLVEAYGLEDEEFGKVSVADSDLYNPGRVLDDARVTVLHSDSVFEVSSSGDGPDRVLVVMTDGAENETVVDLEHDPVLGDRIDATGRVAALDVRMLAEHGVKAEVLAGARLPEMVVYADSVQIEK